MYLLRFVGLSTEKLGLESKIVNYRLIT